MDFSFNEESAILRDSARRFLSENCSLSLLRKMLEQEEGFSRPVWKKMSQLGWLGLIYDEKYGGVGGTFLDLFFLFEQMGKVLLPGPFFWSAVFSGLVVQETDDERFKSVLLPSIIQGEKIFTTAFLNERGKYDSTGAGLTATAGEGSFTLEGTRSFVPYAAVADEIILFADLKGSGPTLFRVDARAEDLEIVPLQTIAREKVASILSKNTKIPGNNILGEPGKGNAYIDAVLPKAIVCKCGEMLGGVEQVFEMTVAYAKERHQFGRPLGSLQVLQHYCANMATYLETSRLVAYQAASLLSEGILCQKEVSMAKAWISDAYKTCTWIAHQIHGAIGFTEEHDLHFFYKHAKVAELEFGDAWVHRNQVAGQMGLRTI